MKFSHLKLEKIRINPSGIRDILSVSDGGRLSMNRVWFFAARKYHQSGGDRNFCMNYFDRMFDEKFVLNVANIRKKELLLDKLDQYINSYIDLKFEFYDYSNRISIDIDHGNMIGGELFRFDKTNEGGYAVTILDKENSIWANQLRFPLFQIHYSNVFDCPSELIKVGIYNFEEEKHEYITYDEVSLKTSEDEIKAISKEINNFKL